MASQLRLEESGEAIEGVFPAGLGARSRQSMLRFITCGSVDDGKSTLIGRLLYDSKVLFEDQLATLQKESAVIGTQGRNLDFALLVDGLAAEREQGITIDVAYRFFATSKRKFIVADTPGHEQYTRNMVTGASTADLAVILIDARKGVLTQTRRHSLLVNLLGIRQIVLAVNKMDLVDYDRGRFDEIVDEFRCFADLAGISEFTAIPVSGLAGDNISNRSGEMAWFDGPTLIEHLETVATRHQHGASFRMPVQWVNRPNADFRGYAGRITSGSISVGDEVMVLPSDEAARIARIVSYDGDLQRAQAGQSVTLTLDRELDCSRGDVIAGGLELPAISAQFEADLVWMDARQLQLGRAYLLKIGTRTVAARIEKVRNIIDVNSFASRNGEAVELNDIARCEILLDRALPIVPYGEDRELGGFILIDKLSNATVAAGMVRSIAAKAASSGPKSHEGEIFWLSGLGPEARDDFAHKFQIQRKTMGAVAALLRAEDFESLNRDLDPGEEDERQRRLREVAVMMAKAGMDVIITFDVSEDQAWPGRWIGPDEAAAEGALEWVI